MQTYYIKIERRDTTLAIIRVQAESLEEAKNKALKIRHQDDDIYEVTHEAMVNELQKGKIDYLTDETEGDLWEEDLEERGEL